MLLSVFDLGDLNVPNAIVSVGMVPDNRLEFTRVNTIDLPYNFDLHFLSVVFWDC